MTHPLLTPRYMVEADYPNSPFRVGDVLIVYVDLPYKGQRTCMKEEYEPWKITHIDEPAAQKYPHIFRPMHWSEQKELGEMPRYLIRNGRYEEAHSYDKFGSDWWVTLVSVPQTDHVEHLYAYLPATEAEYLEYLKSKEK